MREKLRAGTIYSVTTSNKRKKPFHMARVETTDELVELGTNDFGDMHYAIKRTLVGLVLDATGPECKKAYREFQAKRRKAKQ